MSTQGKYAWEQAMEAEEERQKEALRKFLERERQPMHVSGKDLLWFLLKVLFIAASVGLFVYYWLELPI